MGSVRCDAGGSIHNHVLNTQLETMIMPSWLSELPIGLIAFYVAKNRVGVPQGSEDSLAIDLFAMMT